MDKRIRNTGLAVLAVATVGTVAAFVISYLFLNSTLTTAFIVIVATMIVLYPIIIRLSRNIWINLFMSYDKNLDKTNKA